MNVLIINSDLPVFPGGAAHEHLNTIHLAKLANRVGLVSMAHTAEALEQSKDLAAHGIDLYLWENPSIGKPVSLHAARRRAQTLSGRLHRDLASTIAKSRMLRSRPHDSVHADLAFRNMSASILKALSDGPWDALVIIQSSYAAVLDSLPEFRVSALVMHDIRSVVYERRAKAAPETDRARLMREARRHARFEREYGRRFDLLIAVSETDAEWMRAHYHPPRIAAVPIPVDPDFFSPAPGCERPGRIVFTGHMGHPPNIDAAIFFATEIFPRVRMSQPDAEFYVVGREPAPAVAALGQLPGITVTGGVPDIRPFLASACVVVVPLRFGSGVRNKILEAWSMCKCIVSTTIGAEGLPYRDGVDLAIADDADRFAGTVNKALADPNYRESLQYSGRAVAVKEHDPRDVGATYFRALRDTLRAKTSLEQPVRTLLDLRWMLPGRAGGIENLARSFVRELVHLDAHNRYTVILPAASRYDLDLRAAPNFRVLCRDSMRPLLRDLKWRAAQFLHDCLHLDHWRSPAVQSLRFLRSLDSEVAYSFPGFIHPELNPLRHVLQVPDIQHEYFPEFFLPAALEERRRIYGDSIRRADHICAISEFTRQTLIERMGVAPAKITTTLLAADPIFTPVETGLVPDAVRLREYGLQPGRYLFFPAHTWKHKNHRAAIDAVRILRDRHAIVLPLICTGGEREAQPELYAQIDEAGLFGQVHFLGYCPRDVLPVLYRGAACLVFPSLFEGFGMPVLEAMACGTPVVCSDTTSLPEVAGNAAMLVDPNDAGAIARSVRDVLQSRELRDGMKERGLAQAARFSWRKFAILTIAAIHQVARGESGDTL